MPHFMIRLLQGLDVAITCFPDPTDKRRSSVDLERPFVPGVLPLVQTNKNLAGAQEALSKL